MPTIKATCPSCKIGEVCFDVKFAGPEDCKHSATYLDIDTKPSCPRQVETCICGKKITLRGCSLLLLID